ncbi:MAG TPA: hypothetical protein VG347_22660 [Verrucomicrobiae bacterium]|nr:hypothetical protein [Verrucomicrobiae bacterium]
MSVSMYLFVTAMVIGAAFLMGMTWIEVWNYWVAGWRQIAQRGESSLGRNSVNWLGGIALLTAIAICVLVK